MIMIRLYGRVVNFNDRIYYSFIQELLVPASFQAYVNESGLTPVCFLASWRRKMKLAKIATKRARQMNIGPHNKSNTAM